MKKNLIYTVLLVGGLVITALSVSAQNTKPGNQKTTQQKVQYTCPMHKQVISDKPGKCPICGMDLVVLKTTQPGNMMYNTGDSTQMQHHHMMSDSTNYMYHQRMNDSTGMKHEHHQM